MRYLNTRLRLLLCCALAASPAVRAAEWRIDPELEFRAGYNDNIRLSTQNEVSSAEAGFSPRASFSRNTEISGLAGIVDFDFRRYEESSDLDENNARFELDGYRNLEHGRLSLNLAYINDTTLNTQLEATGITLGRVDRQRYTAAPGWSYFFNPRNRLDLRYRYDDVFYKNVGLTPYVDYTVNTGQASLISVLDERITASATLSYSASTNDNDVNSANTSLNLGVEYRFSETLSVNVSGGLRRTQTDYTQNTLIPIFSGNQVIAALPLSQDISNSDWGYTYNVSFKRKGLRGDIELSASQNISNDINGQPIEVLQLGLNGRYRASEKMLVGLKLKYYDGKAQNSISTRLSRSYISVEPFVGWQLKEFWRISGSYRYRQQTFDDIKNDATQNAAYLTLTYQWPRIAVSR